MTNIKRAAFYSVPFIKKAKNKHNLMNKNFVFCIKLNKIFLNLSKDKTTKTLQSELFESFLIFDSKITLQ